MDKLNFVTAGIPTISGEYKTACDTLRNLDLDGMELEFVHGVRMNPQTQELLKETKNNLIFTAHAPFYVNLNAKEEDKIEASKTRIIKTARMTNSLGGFSIVYHAGFYLGQSKEDTYNKIKKCHEEIIEVLEKENNKIWIRPETTGKKSQWGDLDEVIKLSKEFDQVLPCIDFSHLHARANGIYNTYDEFCEILDKIGKGLGQKAFDNFHAHIAGIAYTEKGEKHHLVLDESDMNYKDLLKAFKTFNIKGVVVCESPNIEVDCEILKSYYKNL